MVKSSRTEFIIGSNSERRSPGENYNGNFNNESVNYMGSNEFRDYLKEKTLNKAY